MIVTKRQKLEEKQSCMRSALTAFSSKTTQRQRNHRPNQSLPFPRKTLFQLSSYSNPLPPPNPIPFIELLFALLNSAIFAVFSALLLALASTMLRLSSALA